MNQRSRIEQEVSQRACHTTRDQVSDTRTHAHMEQMLRREYHGRFLVELLQNARDAWLQENGSHTGGVVRIRLSADPALLVCNQGTRVNADTVLYSLGKFGESTKRYGAGIGYKGIGFKAVREVSLCPEIYSQPNAHGSFDLQVRFDPGEALTLIRQSSPQWDAMTEQLPSAHATADADPLTSIPLLRFPLWVDEVPPSVVAATRMASESFHTVIRLPYDPRFDQHLAFNQDTWLQRIRTAMEELTDEIVVLLEAFTTMLIEDELAATTTCIVRQEVGTARQLANNGTVHDIRILRNNTLSSRWRLYKRSLSGFPDHSLEGDIAVGVRLTTEAPDHLRLDLSQLPHPSFHLFFPTHIPTHLPFLLHAYFELDASRKGFAGDAEERNRKLLCGLCDLVVDAVWDLAAAGGSDPVDITSFPTLFAHTTGEPEAPLARDFRNNVLTALDGVPWVRVRAPAEGPRYAAPRQLLVAPEARLAELLPTAFPPAYALRRVDRFHPDAAIAEQGRCFLAARFPTAVRDNLEALLTPGGENPWAGEQTAQEHGFCAILALLNFLEATDREPIRTLIETLQGNAQATIIPVVDGTTGEYRLIVPPLRCRDTQESEEDSASRIFARRSRGRAETLAPPPCLDIAFVPDGMLTPEHWEGVARRLLGIREYTTDAVLDRLTAVLDHLALGNPAEATAVLTFIWRLLLQESGSTYSVDQALRTGSPPGEWYWCKPRRALSDSGRAAQRREYALARLPVLTRAGTWRPADELVFGSDWAERLEACVPREIPLAGWSADTLHQRCALYRDLEALAPRPDSLVAAPDHLAARLPFSAADVNWLQSDETLTLMQGWHADLHLILLHAFLLRLGVWEVLPLKAVVDYRTRSVAEHDPWVQHPGRTAHREAIRAARGWFFGAPYEHQNVQVAEDYQLAWDLPTFWTY